LWVEPRQGKEKDSGKEQWKVVEVVLNTSEKGKKERRQNRWRCCCIPILTRYDGGVLVKCYTFWIPFNSILASFFLKKNFLILFPLPLLTRANKRPMSAVPHISTSSSSSPQAGVDLVEAPTEPAGEQQEPVGIKMNREGS
jgi:hypothetical protein